MITLTIAMTPALSAKGSAKAQPGDHHVGVRIHVPAQSSNVQFKVQIVNLEKGDSPRGSSDTLTIYHRDGKGLDPREVAALVPSRTDTSAPATATDAGGQRDIAIVAVAVYEQQHFTFTEYIYDDSDGIAEEIEPFDVTSVAARIQSVMAPLLEEAELPQSNDGRHLDVGLLAAPNGTTHITSFSGTCRDSTNGYLAAGTLSNVFTQVSRGATTYNGKAATIWDSRARHTSNPNNDYQTREVRTRHDQGQWFSQDIISHGPFTTTSGHSVTVSLGVKGPSVSWTFDKPSVRIYDTTSSPNYARWVFDIVLGTNASRFTYVSEPGLRLVNTVGQVAFRNQVHMYYYRNLSHYCMMNIGPEDAWFNDR